MASDNSSLAGKRARAADLERRVSRKISRIKSKTGAIVANTEFDPRKGAGKVQTMRTRDVESHIRKLEKTLSRATQFVAGVRGAPLPRKAFNAYKTGEQALTGKAEADIARFANERLPGPGTETIGQRQAKIRTKHPTAMNKGYIPPERQPFNIKDIESLKKLTKSNAKRMTKKFAKAEHERAKVEFGKMVEVFKNEKLTKDVTSLSSGQFDMLWNLTRFADAMSLSYHHIKAKFSDDEQVPESVLKDQIEEATSLVAWVKKFKI